MRGRVHGKKKKKHERWGGDLQGVRDLGAEGIMARPETADSCVTLTTLKATKVCPSPRVLSCSLIKPSASIRESRGNQERVLCPILTGFLYIYSDFPTRLSG